MNALRLTACAAILMLASGSGYLPEVQRGAGMQEIDEASTRKAVTVRLGEQMRVRLRETASTGYRWTGGDTCTAVLHLDDEHAVSPKDAAPGASGARVWMYTAAGPGRCELKYVSARSWEKEGSGKTVSFLITVAR